MMSRFRTMRPGKAEVKMDDLREYNRKLYAWLSPFWRFNISASNAQFLLSGAYALAYERNDKEAMQWIGECAEYRGLGRTPAQTLL